MPRQNQTTIKLSLEEIECLLGALGGVWTDHLEEDELATHERMLKRLDRALDRV